MDGAAWTSWIALAATGAEWLLAAAWPLRVRALGRARRTFLRPGGGWRRALGLATSGLGLAFLAVGSVVALVGDGTGPLLARAWGLLAASTGLLWLRLSMRRIHVREEGIAWFPFVWRWERIASLEAREGESGLELRPAGPGGARRPRTVGAYGGVSRCGTSATHTRCDTRRPASIPPTRKTRPPATPSVRWSMVGSGGA